MNKRHTVEKVNVEGGMLHLTVDGRTVAWPVADLSSRLATASDAARRHIVVSPSGYGLHWPDCDEDLSIDALPGIRHEVPMTAAENADSRYQAGGDSSKNPSPCNL